MEFEFNCATCGEVHRGMPTFGAHAPLSYYSVPTEERQARCSLGSDDCVIDEKWFFVKGCLEIPVHGQQEKFSWGVWVSLSAANFKACAEFYDVANRSHLGPFFGSLDAWLKPYPETVNLKTRSHLRDNGIRPFIELEPTDHPLAIEQREGISVERVGEIYSQMVHDKSP